MTAIVQPTGERGQRFLTEAQLLETPQTQLLAFEHAADEFAQEHPDYEFEVTRAHAPQGVLIRWRRR